MAMSINHARDLNDLRADLLDIMRYERSLPGIKQRLKDIVLALETKVTLAADSGLELDDGIDVTVDLPETRRDTIPYKNPETLAISESLPPEFVASPSFMALKAIEFFQP